MAVHKGVSGHRLVLEGRTFGVRPRWRSRVIPFRVSPQLLHILQKEAEDRAQVYAEHPERYSLFAKERNRDEMTAETAMQDLLQQAALADEAGRMGDEGLLRHIDDFYARRGANWPLGARHRFLDKARVVFLRDD